MRLNLKFLITVYLEYFTTPNFSQTHIPLQFKKLSPKHYAPSSELPLCPSVLLRKLSPVLESGTVKVLGLNSSLLIRKAPYYLIAVAIWYQILYSDSSIKSVHLNLYSHCSEGLLEMGIWMQTGEKRWDLLEKMVTGCPDLDYEPTCLLTYSVELEETLTVSWNPKRTKRTWLIDELFKSSSIFSCEAVDTNISLFCE